MHPLQSRLKQAGLSLDAATANIEVRHWLAEVANCRVHGELKARPAELLQEERKHLLPLSSSLAEVREITENWLL